MNSHLFQGSRSYRTFLFPIAVTSMRSAEWVTIASIWQGKQSRLTGPRESQDYRAEPRPRPRIVLPTVLDKHGNPLQYSCLDRGAWRATVHGLQSWTRLKRLSTYHSTSVNILLGLLPKHVSNPFPFLYPCGHHCALGRQMPNTRKYFLIF